MCAAPAKTSDEAIVLAAREIVAANGATELSMQAVAEAVRVRAPSLYKRFPSRDALLDAVALGVLAELGAKMERVAKGREGVSALEAMARGYRDFAKRSPHLYRLLFTKRVESADLDRARASSVRPVIEVLSQVVTDPADLLPAARMLTAFLHGFVTMEIDGAFHLGGDVTRAFEFSVAKILSGLSGQRPVDRR